MYRTGWVSARPRRGASVPPASPGPWTAGRECTPPRGPAEARGVGRGRVAS